MTPKEFEGQINRLRSEWKNSYGAERTAVLWKVFSREDHETFACAIEWCLTHCRGAPLLDDLNRGMEEVKKANSSIRNEYYAKSFSGVLDEASKRTTADPHFVEACTKLLEDRLSGRINMDQFLQGCDLLDQAARQFA